MRAMLRLLRILVAVTTAVLVVLVLVYASLRMGMLEGPLDRIIGALAQKEGVFFVRAEGVSGSPPEQLRVRRVEIGDSIGVWLVVEDAELTWHPFDLFHVLDPVKWRVVVENVHARRVAWTRLPDDGPDEDDEPFRWDRFIRILVNHLVVDDFHVSGTLLGGKETHLRVEGSGILGEWEHGFVKLDITHADDKTGHGRVDLATHGSPIELSGTIEAEEGPGGALAALARLDDAGSVKLAVRASGPMRHGWHGEADVIASNIGELHAKTELRYTADGPFEVTGTFDPVAGQREKYLVGEGAPIDLYAKGAWAPDVELRFDRVRLVADGRELSADGRLDLVTKAFRVAGSLARSTQDPGPVAAAEATPVHLTLLDVASARIEGSGTLGDGGNLDATLDVVSPARDGVSLDALRVVFHAKDPLGEDPPSYELTGDGKGFALDHSVMPLFGAEPRLTARGRIDLDAGTLTAEALRLEGRDATLEGPLAIRNEWESMTASLELDATSLASLSGLARMSVAGRATATIDADVEPGWRAADIRAKADATDVVLGEAGWNALIGSAAHFELTLDAAADRPSHAKMSLRAAGIDATATGDIASDGTLVADAHATLENLSRLSDPVRAEIAGRLEAKATARGTRDHFDVVATIDGRKLSYDGIRFDTLTADVDAKDLPSAWAATVHSKGRYGELDAALDGEVAMPSEGRLVLRGLVLRGPKTDGRADLDVDLAGGVASGTVRIASRDLALWRPMTGAAIGGMLDVDAKLEKLRDAGGKPLQEISGTAVAKDLAFVVDGREVFVDTLDAAADRLGLGASPRGNADVHVTRARYGARTLVDGTATATGDGRSWSIGAKVDVRNGEAVKLAGKATLTPGTVTQLVVGELAGTVDETAVRLREPATVRIHGDATAWASAREWSIEPLSVAIGTDGELRGTIVQTPAKFRIDGNAKGLPLALVSTFVPELALDGTVDGDVKLEGADLANFANATGTLVLHGHRVASTGLEVDGVEPVDLRADLRLGGGRVRGTTKVQGLDETRLELVLDAPLASSASAAPVSVDLVWSGSVAEVAALLPIGEDTITGRIDAALHLTGSVAAPRVTGRAVLEGGVWDNATSGVVLRDIRAELEGAGTSLQLRSLTASDGGNGKITANGGIRFEGFPAFDATVNLDATDAMLTRLDLLTTRANANLVLKASRAAGENAEVEGTIKGEARISDARVEIPQKFIADVPEIDVVEIAAPGSAEPAGVLEASRKLALDLDIKVIGDNRIFVTGRGIESEWSSDLHILGTTAEPRIEGTVTSVRGQLSLLGRRFDIQNATLRFDGERDNEPWLAMTAEAEANDITAIADVNGPATRPTIELRSEPSLPRDEVLSRLLFGQSAATLTPMQSVQLARSVAELTGSPLAGGTGFITDIGRSLGFDRVGIESAGANGDAALTASRYLTDRVYVRVQQGLTPESSKLSLEWKIFKHVTIESDVSQDAEGEIGATWRWDY